MMITSSSIVNEAQPVSVWMSTRETPRAYDRHPVDRSEVIVVSG
jgi:hypothetical protein